MSDLAIRVEGLGKLYQIGVRQERYYTLRDTLTETLAWPFRKFSSLFSRDGSHYTNVDPHLPSLDSRHSTLEPSTIWALKEVSFEVKEGEVIGIIGRNGAGKSTLLKILSRITEPTEGYAEVRGRVGSLLGVGTGFHPELTGRENIYLNGAIIGMGKAEIKRKFDEIVAFAEVDKFIDTPVKHYSSGMHVRLAFAVAAHLETEILLVDEVLAVGDAAFQKKCLGTMGDAAKKGRTILFVSHNLQAVALLCPSAILFQNGMISVRGLTTQIIGAYLYSGSRESAEANWPFEKAPGDNTVKLRAVRVLNEKQEVQFDLDMDKPIILQAEFWILRKARITPSFWVYNQEGINLFATANLHDPVWTNMEYEPGLYSCSCTIPDHYLNEGLHHVKIVLTQNVQMNLIEIPGVVSFKIYDRADTRGDYVGPWVGVVRPLLPWVGRRIGDVPVE